MRPRYGTNVLPQTYSFIFLLSVSNKAIGGLSWLPPIPGIRDYVNRYNFRFLEKLPIFRIRAGKKITPGFLKTGGCRVS